MSLLILISTPGSIVSVFPASTVIVEKQGGKVQQKFKIVGSEETDMLQGKLSNRCPLGVAILGKKAGDSFSFNSPAGIMIYKVITIE